MVETPSDDAPMPLPINGAGNGGTIIEECYGTGSTDNQVGVTAGSEDDE